MSKNGKIRQAPDAFNGFISGIINELMQEKDFRDQAKQAVRKIILDSITPEKVLSISGGVPIEDPQLLSIAKPRANVPWDGEASFAPHRPNDRRALFMGMDALAHYLSTEKLFSNKSHWRLDEIMDVYYKHLQNGMEVSLFSFQDIGGIVPEYIDAIVRVSIDDRISVSGYPSGEEAILVCTVESPGLLNEKESDPFHDFSYRVPLFRRIGEDFKITEYEGGTGNAFGSFLTRLSLNCLIDFRDSSFSRPLQLFRSKTKKKGEE